MLALALVLALQQPSIDDLIRDLGADSVETRDAATKALIARGKDALPALEKAKSDPDSEISARAAEAAKTIECNIRAAQIRERLPRAVLEKVPNLPDRLASDSEVELLEIIADFRGVRYSATGLGYEKPRFDFPTREEAAVFEILRERWRESGGDWKRFPKAFINGLVQRGGSTGTSLLIVALDAPTLVDAGFMRALDAPEHRALLLQYASTSDAAEEITRRLDHTYPARRAAAVIALTSCGNRRCRDKVRGMLDDNDAGVRAEACRTAAAFADLEATTKIAGLLKDKDYHVQRAAAEALETLEDPEAAPALLEATRDKDSNVRYLVYNALAATHDPRAADAIRDALDDADGNVRRNSIRAAMVFGLEGLADQIRKWIENDELDKDRWGAMQNLATLEGSKCVPELRKTLDSKIDNFPGTAAFFLGKLGDKESAGLIARLLDGKNSYDSSSAATALHDLGDPRGEAFIRKLLDGPDEWGSAKWRLGAWRVTGIAPKLVEALDSANQNAAESAVSALSRVPDADAPLAEALKHPKPEVRLRALHAIAARKKCSDPDRLVALLDEPDRTVRLAAIEALPADHRDKLKPLLKSSDPDVRLAAAMALEDRDTIRELVDSPIRIIREDAILWLASKGERDILLKLRELLQAPTPNVRSRAIDALLEFGDEAAGPPLLASLARAYEFESAVLRLSALRMPEVAKRLKAVKPGPEIPLCMNAEDLPAWCEKYLGLKAEIDPKASRLPVTLFEPADGLSAVGEVWPGRVPILEADGRVRFVTPFEARRFWWDWWESRHK